MRALPVAALLVLTVLALACGRSGNASVEVTADGSPIPTATPTPTTTETTEPTPTPTATPTPTPEAVRLDLEDLRGFVHPVPGACLPFADQLMPNAPRLYRNGVHEGVDIYPGYACAYVERGTPVVAMFDGVVLRADLDYVEITLDQVNELAARTAAQGYSDPESLDIYRGRQVWIDHGQGVVTRYAHLGSIADGIEVGVEVTVGQEIGGIGESGTPESVTAPGTEMHLHYEVRVGDTFLGDGLPPGQVRATYERLFSGASAEASADARAPVFRRYEARAGDTVASVAGELGLRPESVIWNNEGVESPDQELDAGRELRIPGRDGILHEVRPGETLTSIADRYGADVGNIVSFPANGLADPNLLRVGSTILVPGGRIEPSAADADESG